METLDTLSQVVPNAADTLANIALSVEAVAANSVVNLAEASNWIFRHGTFWALVPPIVAIALALITKEVYSSLFIGVLIGALFISQGSFSVFLDATFKDGLVAKVADPWNVGILFFLVILGTMVTLMNRAGGSAAFGNWARLHIKSKVGAQVATICLGILIFIDDYFNCLTVGSVMRPVTDRFKLSREKLAYLIDSTAAPVCIIAPISSWAAAVSGFVDGEDGLGLFIKAIPFNFYALFTILALFIVAIGKVNFGPMKKYESGQESFDEKLDSINVPEGKGKILDLVVPIVLLIVLCTVGMVYTGGFFASGENAKGFVDAFANSDASIGLVLGSFAALILTLIFYLSRRVLGFNKCMACVPDGFKAMVPAILILCLAWTLKGVTDTLGAKEFVAGIVSGGAAGVMNLMPALIFVIAALLAFATGTSWGTFGILIPIVVAAFSGIDYNLMVISISACMAGAVCGDHCSPISDTTIMASAGAECNHVNHVNTQLPYVLFVAGVSFVTYIIAGFVRNAGVSLVLGGALTVLGLLVLKIRNRPKKKA